MKNWKNGRVLHSESNQSATYSELAEALHLSQQLNHPVQIVWTREDDVSQDYYRPLGMYHLKGALDEEGRLTCWYLNAATTSRYMYRNEDRAPHKTEVFPRRPPDFYL